MWQIQWKKVFFYLDLYIQIQIQIQTQQHNRHEKTKKKNEIKKAHSSHKKPCVCSSNICSTEIFLVSEWQNMLSCMQPLLSLEKIAKEASMHENKIKIKNNGNGSNSSTNNNNNKINTQQEKTSSTSTQHNNGCSLSFAKPFHSLTSNCLNNYCWCIFSVDVQPNEWILGAFTHSACSIKVYFVTWRTWNNVGEKLTFTQFVFDFNLFYSVWFFFLSLFPLFFFDFI